MAQKNLVRVILRSDGSVHIAFRDVRAICASAQNLMELFSDPIDFIEKGSLQYQDSTFIANRRRVELEDVLGLTLATVNSDKQIVCDFPELFQYVFQNATSEEDIAKPLSMHELEYSMVLADEKSFLLRYYLEFTQNLKSRVAIQKNIKLRDEVQFAIIREILNAYFEEELPPATKAVDLSRQIALTESENLLEAAPASPEDNMITALEYAKLWNLSVDTVTKYCREKRLLRTKRTAKGWLIDKTEEPPKYDQRRGRKRRKTGEEKFFKRAMEGSPEEVREYIKKRKFFTDEVGKYIRTYAEVNYYVDHSYHEIVINGRHALIIDVNPDYIVPDKMVPQKVRAAHKGDPEKVFQNRDLMKSGCAPVFPKKNWDHYLFHIHHIGQKNDSAFCALPEFDHLSKKMNSVFHQGTPDPNLHNTEFEVQKSSFWRQLLKEYEKAGNAFNAIPYLNPKQARYKD